jgi:cyclophilin family peptidyl-prolyl cis-trans isomerase
MVVQRSDNDNDPRSNPSHHQRFNKMVHCHRYRAAIRALGLLQLLLLLLLLLLLQCSSVATAFEAQTVWRRTTLTTPRSVTGSPQSSRSPRLLSSCWGLEVEESETTSARSKSISKSTIKSQKNQEDQEDLALSLSRLSSRRETLATAAATAFAVTTTWWTTPVVVMNAADAAGIPLPNPEAKVTENSQPVITDYIFLSIKGIPPLADQDASNRQVTNEKIVIGLYGKNAPNSVRMLSQLVSQNGLPAPCRPRAERALAKEQLEANKVYNACRERKDEGVSLRYSTIWRIVPNVRIDVGAVTGKYLAREYPTWSEEQQNESIRLRHDVPGVVSVRRGNQGGFGFAVYPGNDSTKAASVSNAAAAVADLDDTHIVVGRVVQGLDLVQALNTRVPIVTSAASFNYMALTGGPQTSTAPDRSCRYGGPMYCNENKPLVKLVVVDAGIGKGLLNFLMDP